MTAKCELRVRPDIERLDVQIFGKTTETLRLSGVLIEAED
jgi:hypothetical protein